MQFGICMANDLINQTAQEAVDYVGSPSSGGGPPPPNWWEKVKLWITNHLKPLVPAAELARTVAQVIDIIKKWFSRP